YRHRSAPGGSTADRQPLPNCSLQDQGGPQSAPHHAVGQSPQSDCIPRGPYIVSSSGGSKSLSGGPSVHESKTGGAPGNCASRRSTWLPENSAPLKLTSPPEDSANAKASCPPESVAPPKVTRPPENLA